MRFTVPSMFLAALFTVSGPPAREARADDGRATRGGPAAPPLAPSRREALLTLEAGGLFVLRFRLDRADAGLLLTPRPPPPQPEPRVEAPPASTFPVLTVRF